jgi:hypothetical protein
MVLPGALQISATNKPAQNSIISVHDGLSCCTIITILYWIFIETSYEIKNLIIFK